MHVTIPDGPRLLEDRFNGCSPYGTYHPGQDFELNLFKNRIAVPSRVQAWDLQRLLDLTYPRDVNTPRNVLMQHWTAADRRAVFPLEETAVSTVGYITALKPGEGEPANCDGEVGVDWHIYLGTSPNATPANSVITEATPRVRALEPGFNLRVLQQLQQEREPVRVSGWLMLDYWHSRGVGETRGTLWEIHPVTRIDAFSDGSWHLIAG